MRLAQRRKLGVKEADYSAFQRFQKCGYPLFIFFEWTIKEILGTSRKSVASWKIATVRARPRLNSFYWRAAMSFAIASCFTSDDPFGSDVSFTRDPLSMTIGFNILVAGKWPVELPFWFVAGNGGLFSGLVTLIERMH